MFTFNKRKRYVRAMMRAIKKAAEPVCPQAGRSSKTDALRAIRRFEKIFATSFDPFDREHLRFVSCRGNYESIARSMHLCNQKMLNKLRG